MNIDIIIRVFIKKIIYQMSINKGENNQNSRCPYKYCENSILSSLSLLVKSLEEEIQLSGERVDTSRG